MKTQLTEQDKSEYLKSGGDHCPFCETPDQKIGGVNLSGGHVNIEGKYAHQDVRCENCGSEWTDVFERVEIQETETEESAHS